MSLLNDYLSVVTGGLIGNGSSLVGNVDALTSEVGAIAGALTDGKMWRSLGWLILGIIILGWGVTILLRAPIEKAVGTVVGSAAKAAI